MHARLRSDPAYGNVYIRPDMTYQQRQRDSELRDEVKRRRKKGEKNLKIVRGKVALYNPTLNSPGEGRSL